MSQTDIHQTSKPASRDVRDSQTTVAEQSTAVVPSQQNHVAQSGDVRRNDSKAKAENLLAEDVDEKRREVSDPADKAPKKQDAERDEASPAIEKPHMKKPAERDGKPDEEPSLDIRASNSPHRNAPRGKPWTTIPTRAGLLYTNGTDALVDERTHVTGSTGSSQEVDKMFALGKAKGWNPMTFNGGEAFKANVIREALKKGFEVKTFSERDAKLYADLEKEFLAARGQAKDGRKEHAGPSPDARSRSSINDERRQATPPKSDKNVGAPETNGIGNSLKDKSATSVLEEQKLNSGGAPRDGVARTTLDRETDQPSRAKVLSGHKKGLS